MHEVGTDKEGDGEYRWEKGIECRDRREGNNYSDKKRRGWEEEKEVMRLKGRGEEKGSDREVVR